MKTQDEIIVLLAVDVAHNRRRSGLLNEAGNRSQALYFDKMAGALEAFAVDTLEVDDDEFQKLVRSES